MMARTLVFIVGVLAALPAAAQTPVVSLKAAGEVGATTISSRGDRIAAVVGKDRVAIWSLPDGKLIQELKFPQRPIATLFAPGDEIVVSLADGPIEVRAIATGSAVRRMDAGTGQDVLAVSADGRLFASSGTEQIRLWNASGKLLRTFGHEFGSMGSLAFSPDGTLLASAGYDTNVHLWDVSTGVQRASMRDRDLATFAVAFTADGKSLVIGGVNGAIEIVDVQTASVVRRLPAEKYALIGLSLAADGRSAGAVYMDVDGMTRPAPLVVWELASGRVKERMTAPGPPPAAVGFAADGRFLYATTKGPELAVWVR
jgi:WD40 repeat protein